jgi:hypothetical protein
MDQWNRRENKEISHHIYVQTIFDKMSILFIGIRVVFSTELRKLGSHMQKHEVELLSNTVYKN